MHSTPQRLPNMCLTQPLPPALSDSQVVGVEYSIYSSTYTTENRKRLGETYVWKPRVLTPLHPWGEKKERF